MARIKQKKEFHQGFSSVRRASWRTFSRHHERRVFFCSRFFALKGPGADIRHGMRLKAPANLRRGWKRGFMSPTRASSSIPVSRPATSLPGALTGQVPGDAGKKIHPSAGLPLGKRFETNSAFRLDLSRRIFFRRRDEFVAVAWRLCLRFCFESVRTNAPGRATIKGLGDFFFVLRRRNSPCCSAHCHGGGGRVCASKRFRRCGRGFPPRVVLFAGRFTNDHFSSGVCC